MADKETEEYGENITVPSSVMADIAKEVEAFKKDAEGFALKALLADNKEEENYFREKALCYHAKSTGLDRAYTLFDYSWRKVPFK